MSIAIYMRLSLEDNKVNESESIKNQRKLLKKFLLDNKEFNGLDCEEFIDDGYSGTNFNRPAMQKLLNNVKEGKVDCIIVKDFSRFGRNFIEVGDYIEQIFPLLGVRFIAVNNSYDSNKKNSDNSDIDVAFKNLLNDYYSKDISAKVKSAKKTKMKNGDFISSYAFYGYKKSDSDKNKLVIDSEAEKVVRYIFDLALDNFSTTQIAKILNSEKILTPKVYKDSKGLVRKWNVVDDGAIWSRSAVLRILKDERYTGKFIGGKKESRSVGSKKFISIDKTKWIVVPDTHEAIISEEVFWKVNDKIRKEPNRKRDDYGYPLKGKVFCGVCNHTLRRKCSSKEFYYCETSKVAEINCINKKLYETNLEDIILSAIESQIKIIINKEEYIDILHKNRVRYLNDMKNECSDIISNIDKLNLKKMELYEKYLDKNISKESYIEEKHVIIVNIENLKKEKILILEKINICEETLKLDNRYEKLEEFLNFEKLNNEIVSNLISKVIVYDENKIEIVWNFTDYIM